MQKSHEVPRLEPSEVELKDAACVIARYHGILAYTEMGGGGSTQITISVPIAGKSFELIFGDANEFWGADSYGMNDEKCTGIEFSYESRIPSWCVEPNEVATAIRAAADEFYAYLLRNDNLKG